MSKRSLVAISGLLAIALTITLIWGFAEKARFKELTTTFDKIETERDTLKHETIPSIHKKYKVDLAMERNKTVKLAQSIAEKTLDLRNTKTLNQKRLDVLRASTASAEEIKDEALYELQLFVEKENKWNFLFIDQEKIIFSLKRQVKLLENKLLDFEGAMAKCMSELDSAIASVNKYKKGGLGFGFRLFGLNIKVKPGFAYVVDQNGGKFGPGVTITF